MAQIIKHRRGRIENIPSITANSGEIVIASGSVGNLVGPFIFMGSPDPLDDGQQGRFRAINKIFSGVNAPTLTSATWGTALDGIPFYASGDKALYILNNDNVGNTKLNLVGNIEGGTISGLTIKSPFMVTEPVVWIEPVNE